MTQNVVGVPTQALRRKSWENVAVLQLCSVMYDL